MRHSYRGVSRNLQKRVIYHRRHITCTIGPSLDRTSLLQRNIDKGSSKRRVMKEWEGRGNSALFALATSDSFKIMDEKFGRGRWEFYIRNLMRRAERLGTEAYLPTRLWSRPSVMIEVHSYTTIACASAGYSWLLRRVLFRWFLDSAYIKSWHCVSPEELQSSRECLVQDDHGQSAFPRSRI